MYCSFILPYITYSIEVWGNTYKTNTNPIFILQKRAIRIINKTNYREPTNQLFIQLKTLKFKDLVDLKTAHIMFKAGKKILPHNIQKLFQARESHYNLRGVCMFEQPLVRINAKYHCISVKGVLLWNKCREELKLSVTWNKFKKMYTIDVLKSYMIE